MSFYLDTSFLVSIFIDEARSPAAREWWKLNSGDSVISAYAAMEFAAVVSRRVRTGVSNANEARAIVNDFDELRGQCGSHVHGGADFELALRLVRDLATKLAAPDALHLASAINLDARLVTFDARLADAAAMRRVRVVAPG